MPVKKTSDGALPLGIEDNLFAFAGDHIAYFWECEDDFVRGVRFLERGLQDGDHCVVFGYEEANAKVLQLLSAGGFSVEDLLDADRLAVLGGQESIDSMLEEITTTFTRLLEKGALCLRLLGNIGWGRSGWPSEADILVFETRITDAIADLPCVVVCMYDVESLPGRILVHGALEAHPLTLRRNIVRENPGLRDHNQFTRPFLTAKRKSS